MEIVSARFGDEYTGEAVQKKAPPKRGFFKERPSRLKALLQALVQALVQARRYISIPPMPPPPGIGGPDASFFGASAIIASVVSSRPDTEAAFCSA